MRTMNKEQQCRTSKKDVKDDLCPQPNLCPRPWFTLLAAEEGEPAAVEVFSHRMQLAWASFLFPLVRGPGVKPRGPYGCSPFTISLPLSSHSLAATFFFCQTSPGWVEMVKWFPLGIVLHGALYRDSRK